MNTPPRVGAPAVDIPAVSEGRRAELHTSLARVHERIARACEDAGRCDQPQLIVVTKFFPAEDVQALYELGVREVGENKEQEARAKAEKLGTHAGLNWNFIGQLQRNKSKSVARFANAVHSVDRAALARSLSQAVCALQQEAAASGNSPRPDLDCFIQINLDEATGADDADAVGRGGAHPQKLMELADLIHGLPGLRLRGLMAVAPLGGDPNLAFSRLRELSARLTAKYPDAHAISAGMSQDLEAAVQNGATHLRIGSDVLGARPKVR